MCMLTLYCSIDNDIPPVDYRYLAMVDYKGGVTWYPSAKFRSCCQIDMRRFPFDEQRSSDNLFCFSFHLNIGDDDNNDDDDDDMKAPTKCSKMGKQRQQHPRLR